MGKRSEFHRRPQDKYYTPYGGVIPLLPFLKEDTIFAEPCAGDGRLFAHLEKNGHRCLFAGDIEPGALGVQTMDVFELVPEHFDGCETIITNPPWSRPILHELIKLLPTFRPTWLLFDADWMHTRQSSELIITCDKIVSVGRLKWIEGSPSVGKDNCAWYHFPGNWQSGPRFYGRTKNATDKANTEI